MKYAPYSHSKIQTGYCPFAFKKRYIDHDKGISRGNSDFGGMIHLIIADVIKAQVNEKEYSLVDLINKHITHDLLPRMQEIQEVLEIFRMRFRFNKENVVGVEERMAIDENGDEAPWDNSLFRGIIDLIEIDGAHGIITDHKTQFNIFNQEEMDNNDQMTGYCYLAHKIYPQLKTFTIRIYFARYGAYRSTTREIKDLELMEQRLGIAIEKIEQIEEWVSIAGASCVFCDYISDCPLAQYDPNGSDIQMVTTHAQAIEQARLLRVREEQNKKSKELLQAYCSVNGPVEISGDYAYGYVDSESNGWDMKALKEVLEKNGQELTAYVTVHKESVKKLIKSAKRLDPDLADSLENIAVEEIRTAFRGHKLR
jgi:hypothetical protein